jgi:hypothetical protein
MITKMKGNDDNKGKMEGNNDNKEKMERNDDNEGKRMIIIKRR